MPSFHPVWQFELRGWPRIIQRDDERHSKLIEWSKSGLCIFCIKPFEISMPFSGKKYMQNKQPPLRKCHIWNNAKNLLNAIALHQENTSIMHMTIRFKHRCRSSIWQWCEICYKFLTSYTPTESSLSWRSLILCCNSIIKWSSAFLPVPACNTKHIIFKLPDINNTPFIKTTP